MTFYFVWNAFKRQSIWGLLEFLWSFTCIVLSSLVCEGEGDLGRCVYVLVLFCFFFFEGSEWVGWELGDKVNHKKE